MNKLDLETIIIITNHHKKKVVYRKRMYVNQIQWKGLGAEGGGLILIKKKRGRDMEVIHMIDKVT